MTLGFKKILMVHHLHDGKRFPKITGSISFKKFEKIVKNKDILFTFDDGYKSQLKASKILNKFKKRGIFFIHTNHLNKNFEYHEIMKFFVKKIYKNHHNFYKDMKRYFKKKKIIVNKKKKNNHKFYNKSEIELRNFRLKNNNSYNEFISKALTENNINIATFSKKIFLNKKDIYELSKKHEIGLHTNSHPYNFNKLTHLQQFNELIKNKKILEKIIKKKINKFSYPYGKFNKHTITMLKDLGITKAYLNCETLVKNKLRIGRTNVNIY
jgi:peptidoglycan/xylan/chitin deacetylase (PgdA/CDA1 family)